MEHTGLWVAIFIGILSGIGAGLFKFYILKQDDDVQLDEIRINDATDSPSNNSEK